jgi:hypothetical protein
MEHSKKLYVIPSDVFHSMQMGTIRQNIKQEIETKPEIRQEVNHELEKQNIMSPDDIIGEKMKYFTQMMNKFTERKKRIRDSNRKETVPVSVPTVTQTKILLVPKEEIIAKLQEKGALKYNKQGTPSLMKKQIAAKTFDQYMDYVTEPYSSARTRGIKAKEPQNISQIISALSTSDIPLDLIKNKTVRDQVVALRKQKGKGWSRL